MPADVLTLLGPDGPRALAAATALDGLDRLAALTRLRRTFSAELAAAALEQVGLRRAATGKFPDASALLFTRAGMEQASTVAVAAHRAGRLAGVGAVADLCCGIGGDLLALAPSHPVLAVDRDPVALALARHNVAVAVPSASVRYQLADVRDVTVTGLDAVFVDPARRSADGPRRDGDGEPSLAWCASLASTVPAVVVKASPAVPDDLVPGGWEAEFVAEGRELKEATLWSPAWASTSRRATVLAADGVHTLVHAAGDDVPQRGPGAYLLDPNPAVTRAGLVAELARSLGDVAQLDPRIAFLTADSRVVTPFARTLPVLASLPWNQRALIGELRRLGAGAVEIRRRGLGGDVDELTRQLRRRLPRDATRRVLIAMTRVADRPWAVICEV